MKTPFRFLVLFAMLLSGCWPKDDMKWGDTGDTAGSQVDTADSGDTTETDTDTDPIVDTAPETGDTTDTANCDVDDDGFLSPACGGIDCNDADSAINPDAIEVCDGVDNDCDGITDYEDAVDATTQYADTDGDGYGDSGGVPVVSCILYTGYSQDNTDCDDTNFAVNPDATEVCNGYDDNCDRAVDEGVMITWYLDADGDGYGVPTSSYYACDELWGYVRNADDCDDARDDIHPGAEEDDCKAVDPTDYNCDGSVGSVDADGDSYTACLDCNDADSVTNPDAIEVCDSVDNDCSGAIDGADAVDAPTWYRDDDSDGYGDAGVSVIDCAVPVGYVENSADCNDGNPLAYPGADETCSAAEDLNCDDSFGSADVDGDTYDACDECDDGNPDVNPGMPESCNGIDDNCDGVVDTDAVDALDLYVDADGDGYGDSGSMVRGCRASGLSELNGDCDDGSWFVSPAATETCNGIDDDCDTIVDEGCAGDTGGGDTGGGDTGGGDTDTDTDTGVSVTIVSSENFGDGGVCTTDPFVRNDGGSMASASYDDGAGECGVFVPGGGSAHGPSVFAIDYSAGGYMVGTTYLVLLDVMTLSTETAPTTFYVSFGGGSVVSATVDPGASTLMTVTTTVSSADNTLEVWSDAGTNYAGMVLGFSISY